jgi:hypothetical protein
METKKMGSSGAVNKRMAAVVGVVIVVVIIVVAIWLAMSRPSAPRVTFAPQGQLIAGFPKDLLLDNAAIVGNSYTIDYTANLNQYTANWTSPSSTLDGLYNQYLNYFTKNGWTITNSTNTAVFSGLYAVTSTADANVTMDDLGSGGLKVTVSYVKK